MRHPQAAPPSLAVVQVSPLSKPWHPSLHRGCFYFFFPLFPSLSLFLESSALCWQPARLTSASLFTPICHCFQSVWETAPRTIRKDNEEELHNYRPPHPERFPSLSSAWGRERDLITLCPCLNLTVSSSSSSSSSPWYLKRDIPSAAGHCKLKQGRFLPKSQLGLGGRDIFLPPMSGGGCSPAQLSPWISGSSRLHWQQEGRCSRN